MTIMKHPQLKKRENILEVESILGDSINTKILKVQSIIYHNQLS